MQQFSTPMMKQYEAIKKQYQDCLLFYRMGDFYELFLDDAFIGARVLNITLTSRPKGKDGRIPMAGVPFHAVDSYLAKLVKAGYKVAICEQVSLPNKYGIVDREVIRIVTPGTLLDEKALEKKENNYIISLLIAGQELAIAIADISTGYFATSQINFDNLHQALANELSRINPVECILSPELYNNPDILKILRSEKGLNIYCFFDFDKYSSQAANYLKNHFHLKSLASFDLEEKALSQQVCSALLGYLSETQKKTVKHIRKIISLNSQEYMALDRSTILNLELFATLREGDTKGSLLGVLDHTITAMGGRLLKLWLRKPLLREADILERHNSVSEFLEAREVRDKLRMQLEKIADIERILSRLAVNIGNARDIINLKESLKTIIEVRDYLSLQKSPIMKDFAKKLPKQLSLIIDYIQQTILDEPAINLTEGNIIKEGVDSQLDSLRKVVKGSKLWIKNLEKKERQKTGISSLKIRFNNIFGFYIEVSKPNLSMVPAYYIRKQTLVNGERFITPALKEHEEIILTAQEKINNLEYTLYQQALSKILSFIVLLQEAADEIARLDCLLNFAYVAERNNYIRPKILYSGEIQIKQGRHPVVEKLLTATGFVPNDINLDNINSQLLLLTGPNMAGKSVLIRQVALISLLNQIGSFVPAKSAYLSLVDRIFVRSGASDFITRGLSTFMVEMIETAYILNYASKNSLIIMDEIGRGTSTYDGISIAWAIAQFLVSNNNSAAKTLFATHYHELQTLEKEFPDKIKNYHMAVSEADGEPVFLHTLLPGGASHSFGIAVAKLAGVPAQVIDNAKQMLASLENRSQDSQVRSEIFPPSNQQILDHWLRSEMEKLDIHQLTPLKALNKLAELKDKVRLIEQRQIPLEAD